MKRLIGALALATACSTVQAGPVNPGTWYGITWSGGVGAPLTGTLAVGSNPGAAPWTITIGAGGGTLTVLDMFNAGDRFSVFNFGAAFGDTSAVPATGGDCGAVIADCLADPQFSRGIFALAAGDYSFTMTLLQDGISSTGQPFSGGSGAFRIDDTTVIPLPPAAALLLTGLFGLGAFARRRG